MFLMKEDRFVGDFTQFRRSMSVYQTWPRHHCLPVWKVYQHFGLVILMISIYLLLNFTNLGCMVLKLSAQAPLGIELAPQTLKFTFVVFYTKM